MNHKRAVCFKDVCLYFSLENKLTIHTEGKTHKSNRLSVHIIIVDKMYT